MIDITKKKQRCQRDSHIRKFHLKIFFLLANRSSLPLDNICIGLQTARQTARFQTRRHSVQSLIYYLSRLTS